MLSSKACEFRTAHGVKLWPLELAEARYLAYPPELPRELHAASGFALDRPHQDVACAACHQELVGDALSSFSVHLPARGPDECRTCHGDPHEGQFANGALKGYNLAGMFRAIGDIKNPLEAIQVAVTRQGIEEPHVATLAQLRAGGMGRVADEGERALIGCTQGVMAISGQRQLVRLVDLGEHSLRFRPDCPYVVPPTRKAAPPPLLIEHRLQAPEERHLRGSILAPAPDRQHTDHDARALVALLQVRAGEGCAHPRHGGPQRAIGERPADRSTKQAVRDRRAGAKGIDHEIEGAERTAAFADDPGPGAARRLAARDAKAGLDRNAPRHDGVEQHVEQGAAMDRISVGARARSDSSVSDRCSRLLSWSHFLRRTGVHFVGKCSNAERVIADIEHDPAGGHGAAIEPVDGLAQASQAIANAKPVEDSEAGRLHEQAGAERLRLGELLDEAHMVAGLGEEQRRGQACWPAAADCDVERRHTVPRPRCPVSPPDLHRLAAARDGGHPGTRHLDQSDAGHQLDEALDVAHLAGQLEDEGGERGIDRARSEGLGKA